MQQLCQCASWQPIEDKVSTDGQLVYIDLKCAKCHRPCGKRLVRRKVAEFAINLMTVILPQPGQMPNPRLIGTIEEIVRQTS